MMPELQKSIDAISLGPDERDGSFFCRMCGSGPLSMESELEPTAICNLCAQGICEKLPRRLAVQQSAQAVAVLASKLDEMRGDLAREPKRNFPGDPDSYWDTGDGLRIHIRRTRSDLSRAIDRWRSEMRKSK